MPFAATGGLGDVLGSLPKAIAEAGEGNVDVRVVMPLYRAVSEQYRSIMKTEAEFEVGLAWRTQYCGIKSLVKDGVTYYFIDNEYYFNRDTLAFINGEKAQLDCEGGDEKEYIMLRLRLKEGLSLSELSRLYSPKACEKIIKKAPLLQKHGLVSFDGETLSLTTKGALLSNSIIAELI